MESFLFVLSLVHDTKGFGELSRVVSTGSADGSPASGIESAIYYGYIIMNQFF